MKIRKMQDKDIVDIIKLITAIMDKEYTKAKTMYPTADLDNIKTSYGGDRNTFFVACDDNDKIIGTVAVKEDDTDTALLRRLFVEPSARHKGCGSELVDAAIDFCKQHNYNNIVFRSTGTMSKANSLLKKKGFQERERFSFDNVEIVRLLKELK